MINQRIKIQFYKKSYRTTGPLKMGWNGDGDRLLSAISASSSRPSAGTHALRFRSISIEPMMIFTCGAGDVIQPGCLVTSRRAAVTGMAVTGVEAWTTVDAVAVAGFDGTSVLWILCRSFSASGDEMLLYVNFEDCSQFSCISETSACMLTSDTALPTGIMVTYFSESSKNKKKQTNSSVHVRNL